MPLSRSTAQITWDTGSNSKTVTVNTAIASDAYTFDTSDIGASLTVYVDNLGTAASGDTVDVYLKWTTGDNSAGGGADLYDTDEHSQFIGRLNTYATDNPGEDPAQRTWDIPVTAKGFKVMIICAAAATRNILVRSRLAYQRAS